MTTYSYTYAQKLLSRIENAAALVRRKIAEHGKINAYEWFKIANDITTNVRCIDICIEREFRQEKEQDK